MRTIALLNQKGGSGKTTTAVNLAAALGEGGKRVLLIDFDPAAAASHWLGIKEVGRELLDALANGTPLVDLIRQHEAPGLEIIPTSIALAAAEKALAGEIGPETLLKKRLSFLPGRWDYILIDCPPSLGILSLNALAAAGEVLIPVEAHVLALEGLVSLVKTVDVVKERLNPRLKICGVLACRVDRRTQHCREIVGLLREKFGSLAYKTAIRETVRLAECPSFSRPITLYASSSLGAQDYRALAREVVEQEGQN